MKDTDSLARRITVWGIWALAVNGMIGAGIFAVPAGAAELTGAWSPLVFAACAIILGLIILCFAELSSRFDATGGPALYVREAFGRFAGFQAGWTVYVSRVTAFAANVSLMVAALGYFFEPLGGGWANAALSAIVILALAAINIAGARQAMGSLTLLTVAKFLPLLAIALGGLFFIDAGAFGATGDAFPPIEGWGTAALLVVYAFVGWESAVIPAGETRNPSRDMPRALIAALVSVTVLYIVIQTVSVAVLGDDLATSERALVDVAQVLFGPVGATVLTLGIVLSVGGNIAGSAFSAPRLTYALARDRTLPAALGHVHPRFATPDASIALFAGIALVLVMVGDFVWLAALSALVRILVYVACIAAMPRIRKLHGARGFTLPGGWTIPVLAVLGSLILVSSVSLNSALATLAALAAGAGLYIAFAKKPAPDDQGSRS